MLSSISWMQYGTTVIVGLAVYYLFVAYQYYLWEILSLIGIKRMEGGLRAIPENFQQRIDREKELYEDHLPKENSKTSNYWNAFTDEVRAYLQNTADTILSKTELLNSLQAIIAKYPALVFSGNNNKPHQFIANATNEIHPEVITPEDIENLFN